jgi:hypothetical protein
LFVVATSLFSALISWKVFNYDLWTKATTRDRSGKISNEHRFRTCPQPSFHLAWKLSWENESPQQPPPGCFCFTKNSLPVSPPFFWEGGQGDYHSPIH